jgi:hypothetical protein
MTPLLREGKIVFIPEQQWLTKNPSFEQPWNGRVMVKYDRAAYRIEISIPVESRHRLIPFVPRYRDALGDCMLPDFDADEDCKNWFVFSGRVKPGWLREITERKVVLV